MLAELESLAARLGVTVRPEPFGRGLLQGRGGLCWVDGKPMVVMDATLRVPDRVAVLAGALAQVDLSGVVLEADLEARIDAARRKRAGRKGKAPKPAKPPRPGLARTRPRGPRT
jgi:hypothetical protein